MLTEQRYCLIGYPLGYSLSPLLHNSFFAQNNINANYISHPLEKKDIEQFIKEKFFDGFNVTVPYKEKIMDYLDEVSEIALKIGAVNTVKKIDDKLIGTNTDADGFLLMLEKEKNFNLKNKNILLFGAGGAAKAICYGALKQNAKKLYLYDLNYDKAAELAKNYNFIQALSSSELILTLLPTIDIIINSTPLGMEKTKDKSVLSDKELRKAKQQTLVVDIIYAPLKTKLLKVAETVGLETLNGIGMLAGQGIIGQKYWFDKQLDYNHAKEIMLSGL